MLKTMLLVGSVAALVTVALPLDLSLAKAEAITCRQAAKIKFAADLHSRAAYRKACKAAWRAEKLNPQPLPPKA
jgi:hypothetical protein